MYHCSHCVQCFNSPLPHTLLHILQVYYLPPVGTQCLTVHTFRTMYIAIHIYCTEAMHPCRACYLIGLRDRSSSSPSSTAASKSDSHTTHTCVHIFPISPNCLLTKSVSSRWSDSILGLTTSDEKAHKYTVCVFDFDAAVELGEDDEMLPISQSNQVTLGLATSREGEIIIIICTSRFFKNYDSDIIYAVTTHLWVVIENCVNQFHINDSRLNMIMLAANCAGY